MATPKKILIDYDFALNAIHNVAVDPLAADPSSPTLGQTYFNTSSKKLRTYNGSTWDEYGSGNGSGSVTSVSVATANGLAGTVANASTTPAITLETTVTGVLKGNGTGISAATSGTDFAPATSGTAILKGNGSGGFSSASAGTDYLAPSGNGSNLTGITVSQVSGAAATASPALTGTPTSPTASAGTNTTQIATTAFVQTAVNSATAGLDPKATAVVVSTSNQSTLSGLPTIDGVTLTAGQRVLLVGQTTASQNGLWAAASGSWSRTTDFASGSTQNGAYVFVESGTNGSGSGYILTGSSNTTVDTSSQTWVQFTGLGEISAGTGLAKSGNTVSIENGGVLTVAHGGTGASTLTGIVKGNGTGAFTSATAGTDYVIPSGSITGNAATATKLATARTINGVGFDGSANITISTTTKYTATIGDGSSTSIAVTDGLGTIDKIATIRDASTGAEVECDITYSSTQTTFGFTSAPAANAYNVVIIG